MNANLATSEGLASYFQQYVAFNMLRHISTAGYLTYFYIQKYKHNTHF